MSGDPSIFTSDLHPTGIYTIGPQAEAFPKLPALAARLGVGPGPGSDGGGRVLLNMSDGTKYDLFALINALLDRLDAMPTSAAERSQP